MLLELRLENDKGGNKNADEVSRKLNECIKEVRDTEKMIQEPYPYLEMVNHSTDMKKVLCISLHKAQNGRKILQELQRCFEQGRDIENILQELYGCPEEDQQGEDNGSDSRILNGCLKKTKDAGYMLSEVLRDCFEEKEDTRAMLQEPLYNDGKKFERDCKNSYTSVPQTLNQKMNKCLEKIVVAGDTLRVLYGYKRDDDGKIEGYTKILLRKILIASIPRSTWPGPIEVLQEASIRNSVFALSLAEDRIGLKR
ncbi:hypothetical protein MKX08_001050 [Trichoderma sp. CBMAI-0020]|nr:hypothetical protein MKX08_001050 [Trichoderma sp. CBMAI-0020]